MKTSTCSTCTTTTTSTTCNAFGRDCDYCGRGGFGHCTTNVGECFYPERVAALVAKFAAEQRSWTNALRSSYVGIENIRQWYESDIAALMSGRISEEFEHQVAWETAVRQGLIDTSTAMELYPPLPR